jgi:Ca2+-binding RTX toxin-like protein
MTNWTRVGLLATCGALAFILAGAASPAITPKLTVTTTTTTNVLNVDTSVGPTDDTVARLQLFMPAGFSVSAPAGGAQVGTAQATANETQLGPQQLIKMSGTVTAIAVDDPAVSWENANCDVATHSAAWLVKVAGGDDSWSFPIFVDQTTGSDTQFGATKLVACFKPVSQESHGNKLVTMTLALGHFTSPSAAGTFRWRSLWTPYAANGTTLNQGASIELFATWAKVAPVTPTPTSTTAGQSSGQSAKGKSVNGTARADTITGTAKNDELNGRGGNDTIRGLGGHDLLIGGTGSDRLFGNGGEDTLKAKDGARDVLDCGTGRDVVYVDRKDVVARNCEIVHRS